MMHCRPKRRARRGQEGGNRSDEETSLSGLSDEQKVDHAWKWFCNYLEKGIGGWVRFSPPPKFAESDGFIPAQYADPGLNNRAVIKSILVHGERGIHYAIGWVELYHLIQLFGILSEKAPINPRDPREILSYQGPPLNNLDSGDAKNNSSSLMNHTKKGEASSVMKSPKISRKKPPAIYTSPLSPEIFEFKASENELSASLKQAAQLHREECNDYVDIDAIQAFTEGYNSRQKKDTQQE